MPVTRPLVQGLLPLLGESPLTAQGRDETSRDR